MNYTLHDILDRLRQQDTQTIVELLKLEPDDLVDAFSSKLEDGFNHIVAELFESSIDQLELENN